MKPRSSNLSTLIAAALAAGMFCAPVAFAADAAPAATAPTVDAVAAKRFALRQSCLRCHSVTKKKDGPTYRQVAEKYRGKPDAEEKLFNHLTSGETAKMGDGHEEPHRDIRMLPPEKIRNLVRWILSQ